MTAGFRLAQNADHSLSAIEAHALWAESYDDAINPLLALEERTMEALLPELSEKTILDLACGTGRWLERHVHRGASRSIGVDLSWEMLDVAAKKAPLSGKLVRANALSIPIRDRFSDLSICSFAVSYMSNLQALSGELSRISRPAADLFISDFHPCGYDRGWKRSFRYNGLVIQIASFAYTIKAICEAFEKVGFALQRRVEPHIDEPERRLFAQAGKLHLFDSAREWPAIFILHFQFSGRGGNPVKAD